MAMTDGEAARSAWPLFPKAPVAGRILVIGCQEEVCLVTLASQNEASITTAASGPIGAEAICYLDGLGVLPGLIGAVTATGFMLRLSLTDTRKARIAARIAWQSEQSGRSAEQRANPRLIPDHRAVVVRLPDGSIHDGQILNLSKSGAKVALECPDLPIVDMLIVVGKRYAKVVRIEEASIAVQFRLPLCDTTLNPAILL